jgi:hypothetical protein
MWAFCEKRSQNGRIATIWKFRGGGIKYHVLNIGGQSANGWIVRGVNCIFPFCFVFVFVFVFSSISAGVVLARLVG